MNMQAQDIDAAMSAKIKRQLASWGFNGDAHSEQIIEHAGNVVSMQGAQVGAIVVALKIADKESVERAIQKKPSGMKTLLWLRENINALAPRYDEILAIHMGLPYISQRYDGIQTHPLLAKKEVLRRLVPELDRLHALPVLVNGITPMLMFSDLETMLHFGSMGRQEKKESALYAALAAEVQSASAFPFSIVADSGTLIQYRRQLEDMSEGSGNATESLQVINEQDAAVSPAAMKVIQILNEAMKHQINDVEIAPDRKTGASHVFFRRYQKLVDSGIVLNGEERDQITRFLMARSGANKNGGRLLAPADGNALITGKMGQAFLRLSFIPLETSSGEAISTSIRLLPRSIQQINMQDLNIPEKIQAELRRFIRRKFGLILVCGPTNSGKSTTIAAMLCQHVNLYADTLKRIAMEEPCERLLPGVLHIDTSQHVYHAGLPDGETKAAMALRSILRHDPDLIMVGEIRDAVTCRVSVDAANTGHLVLTTTHANDPVMGYHRLGSLLPSERRYVLANVIELILAQRLVTTLCPHCSIEVNTTDEHISDLKHYCESKGLEINENEIPKKHKEVNRSGCPECIEGINGMVPIHGLLKVTPQVRRLLLSKDESDWMKAESAGGTEFTLFKAGFDLFVNGSIDLDTVML